MCVCAVLYTLIVSIVRYNSRRRLVAPFTKFVGHRGEKGKRTGELIVGNITSPPTVMGAYRDYRDLLQVHLLRNVSLSFIFIHSVSETEKIRTQLWS